MNNFVGFFDVHTHLLPGVDDGSSCMEETMIMIKIAWEQGIQTMIATPHYAVGRENIPVDELRRIKDMVEEEAKKLDKNIRIYLGNEIFYSDSIIEKLNSKQALTLADSQFVLVEFSYEEAYSEIYRGLLRLVNSGYIPILAHVERYFVLYKREDWIGELIKMGCYMQMNGNSLIGGRMNARVNYNLKLLNNGMVHFLGSDCHDFRVRIPNIKRAVDILLKKSDTQTVIQILYENPMRLLENA